MTDLQANMRRNGAILAIIGAFFAATVIPFLHPPAWLFLQLTYWPLSTVPVEQVLPVGVLLAISGGLTVGVGMAVWALGTYVAGTQPAEAAQVVRVMSWSWFIVDSTCSVVAGAPMNAVLNAGFLALLLMTVRGAGPVKTHPAVI